MPVFYFFAKINGVQVIKSGTDFRELSCITVSFNDDNTYGLDVQRIEITSDIQEDPEVKLTVDKFVGELEMILLLHRCILSFLFPHRLRCASQIWVIIVCCKVAICMINFSQPSLFFDSIRCNE